MDTLNGLGIGRGDRVAIVLPNGPEMAGAFIAVAGGAATAPLNPAYREEEFDFYLGDLRPRRWCWRPARTSRPGRWRAPRHPGRRAGADRARRRPLHAAASGAAPGAPARGGLGEPDDVALVLHTSGTTSRPKIVPLLQRNLLAPPSTSAGRSRSPGRPLPQHHAAVPHPRADRGGARPRSPPAAACVCTPGFNALKFFAWLDEVKPTWYTAVPTMHQAILARAARNAEIIARAALRFIRSSSASLPPQVMAELEATFGVPGDREPTA